MMPLVGQYIIVDPSQAPTYVMARYRYHGDVCGFATAEWDEEKRGFFGNPRWWPFQKDGTQTCWREAT